MDTPSTDPNSAPRKSWRDLTARAAAAKPPGDVDVRCAIREIIASENARPEPCHTQAPQSLIEQLVALSQGLFARLALGSCAASAALVLWWGLDAVAGLSAAIDLQGLFMAAF